MFPLLGEKRVLNLWRPEKGLADVAGGWGLRKYDVDLFQGSPFE